MMEPAMEVGKSFANGWRRASLALSVLALAFAAAASAALAANRFTIDSTPDSFGAVVTDSAGNGYVAWEHLRPHNAADVPMFCKLAPGATSCKHPIALGLPGPSAGAAANADQLFPILGPGRTVWVVTARPAVGDTLVWTSRDGGASFGAVHVILPYSYAGKIDIDDALPVTPSLTTYDRQLYATPTGEPAVFWLASSFDPGLGFNVDNTAETSGGPPGLTEFTFSNPGSGGVTGSALGTTATGEVVVAYWLDSQPAKIAYYTYRAPTFDGFMRPVRGPISPQTAWTGPTVVTAGYMPRLAGGARGLFMVSADGVSQTPGAVDVRKYDLAAHAFGPPRRIAGSGDKLFSTGGIGENLHSGELAVVWPTFSPTHDVMRLFLSTNGGATYSPAQPVAGVQGGYVDADNARVAIADNGTGFVTFWDGRGLSVASLFPDAVLYTNLRVRAGRAQVPVTCPAPKRACQVSVTMTRLNFGIVGRGTFKVAAGVTTSVKVKLTAAGLGLLASSGGRLGTDFRLTLSAPGAPAYVVRARSTLG
jgi:hypothetical protein